MREPRFRVYRTRAGRIRWDLIGPDGTVEARSVKRCTRTNHLMSSIRKVRKYVPRATVESRLLAHGGRR